MNATELERRNVLSASAAALLRRYKFFSRSQFIAEDKSSGGQKRLIASLAKFSALSLLSSVLKACIVLTSSQCWRIASSSVLSFLSGHISHLKSYNKS